MPSWPPRQDGVPPAAEVAALPTRPDRPTARRPRSRGRRVENCGVARGQITPTGPRPPPPPPRSPAHRPHHGPGHREQRQEREQEPGRRRQARADDLQSGPPGPQPGPEPDGIRGSRGARGPQLDGQGGQGDPVLQGREAALQRVEVRLPAGQLRLHGHDVADRGRLGEQRPHPRDAGLLRGDAAVEVDDLLGRVLRPARPAEHGAGRGQVVDEPVQAGRGYADDQPGAGAVDLLLGDDPARRRDRGPHAAGGCGGVGDLHGELGGADDVAADRLGRCAG
jgi:hypothetical protein